jgi:hypothetical protein
MTSTTSIRVATAALIVAGALSPVALAGGEPKNDWPFTTSVHASRTIAQAQRPAQAAEAAGEPKNQLPFTRPVGVERTTAQAQQSSAQAAEAAGEPKNQLPFTRPVAGPASAQAVQALGLSRLGTGEAKNELPFTQPVVAPTIVVHSNGFDWGDAGIGVAAGLGVAAVLAGGLLLTYRGSRGRKLGAAAMR